MNHIFELDMTDQEFIKATSLEDSEVVKSFAQRALAYIKNQEKNLDFIKGI